MMTRVRIIVGDEVLEGQIYDTPSGRAFFISNLVRAGDYGVGSDGVVTKFLF